VGIALTTEEEHDFDRLSRPRQEQKLRAVLLDRNYQGLEDAWSCYQEHYQQTLKHSLPLSGAVGLLMTLNPVAKLGLYSQFGRELVDYVLDHNHWHEVFDQVRYGEHNLLSLGFMLGARGMKIPVEECLVVAGSPENIQTAADLGAYTIAVRAGASKTHPFSQATMILDNIADLVPLIDAQR
jgi:beta-phosphoglucomutase-like phosphatase (HAD superfamily)